jgi:hypothetical protein
VAATRMQEILNGALKRAETLADWSMTAHWNSEDHLRDRMLSGSLGVAYHQEIEAPTDRPTLISSPCPRLRLRACMNGHGLFSF